MLEKIASKEYNSIDILKFILAILVMMIHSGLDKAVISPLLRIAVPLFFIISSFFFFKKNQKISDEKEKLSALWHFVKRNLYLYLFWTIIQLPLCIYVRGYHHDFFPNGVFGILKDILCGSGFTGSWYIIALVIGTMAIFFLSKKISSGLLICITFPFYIICCLYTNYWNLLDPSSILTKANDLYQNVTDLYFHTSFPASLFWIAVGNLFAKKEIAIKTRYLLVGLFASVALITLERYLILKYNLAITDDCYFSLMILCPALFLIIYRNKVVFNTKIRVRETSIIIYVVHGACGRVVGYVLKKIPFVLFQNEIVKIVITFFSIIVVSCIILYVRDKSKIKLFKYAC